MIPGEQCHFICPDLFSSRLNHEVSSEFITNGRKCSKPKPLPSGSPSKEKKVKVNQARVVLILCPVLITRLQPSRRTRSSGQEGLFLSQQLILTKKCNSNLAQHHSFIFACLAQWHQCFLLCSAVAAVIIVIHPHGVVCVIKNKKYVRRQYLGTSYLSLCADKTHN